MRPYRPTLLGNPLVYRFGSFVEGSGGAQSGLDITNYERYPNVE